MEMANITEETEDSQVDSFVDEPSGEEEEEAELSNFEEEEEEEPEEEPPSDDPVAKLLKQLKCSGAAIKRVQPNTQPPPEADTPIKVENNSFSIKPLVQNFHCKKCEEDFPDRWELNNHILQHVKLPFIVIQKLVSDDEDDDEDNQDNWSDEEDDQETEIPEKPAPLLTNAIISSDILKSLGANISIKKPDGPPGLTAPKPINIAALKTLVIKKPPDTPQMTQPSQLELALEKPLSPIERIDTQGSLKLTIKHSVGKDNFQVVNNSLPKEVKKEQPIMTTATANVTNVTTANKDTWEEVDNKVGILESCEIKTEPATIGYSSIVAPSVPNVISTGQARIKDEVPSPPAPPTEHAQPPSVIQAAQSAPQPIIPKPMVIPKKEPESTIAIIEINGDDSDNDDIMFVDATPPMDKKPPIGLPPKAQITEIPTSMPSYSSASVINQTPSFPHTSRPVSTSSSVGTSSQGSTEKQHNFNWNAPSKSFDSLLADKSPDAIFESLLASHRKDGNSDLGTSEYISLDTLGPKHTCDVCQTRFTDLKLLESHRRATGHSNQIVTAGAASSNALVPSYGNSGGFLAMNNLNSFKHIAETVGKLANVNSPSGFSHQQNIMVNIQSFPGQNFMPGQQPPNAYSSVPPQMPGTYPGGYRMPDPNQPYQYPATQPLYGNSTYGQYPGAPPQPPPMYGHPPNAPLGTFPTSQSSYGPNQYGQQMPFGGNQFNQTPQMSQTSMLGSMPPSSMLGSIPTSIQDQSGQQSPNKIGGIKIQNSQSPVPGQKLLQAPGARLTTQPNQPRGQLRPIMRGGTIRGRGGIRPGIRPGVRPGVQVQGQAIRGAKPNILRTPIKRPANSNGSPMTPTKKRLDMLLPDRHDNEDCHVVSMQQQRDGYPLIDSIKGSKETMQLGSGLTVTKTKVQPPIPSAPSKDAGAVASILAQRGIKITAKAKSPSPPPINIPNLGSGISITHKKASSFHIPEEAQETKSAKCDSCPMAYPTYIQLQEHKRLFHNSISEMGLPVIDLSNQMVLRKLNNLGITNFIPLANRDQGGCFGVPIVSVQNAMNGSLNTSLQSLGAGGLLSLGPVKPLPKC